MTTSVDRYVLIEAAWMGNLHYVIDDVDGGSLINDVRRVIEEKGFVYLQRQLPAGWHNIIIRRGRIIGRYSNKKEAEKLRRQYTLMSKVTHS